MALKRRKSEASKDAAVCLMLSQRSKNQAKCVQQNEYAQILAKRVGQVKAAKEDARSKCSRSQQICCGS